MRDAGECDAFIAQREHIRRRTGQCTFIEARRLDGQTPRA
jgi:hypothetical protein